MKRAFLLLTVALLLVALLSLPAFADEAVGVETGRTFADGVIDYLSCMRDSVIRAGDSYIRFTQGIGVFGKIITVVISAAFLALAFFGYRVYRLLSVLVATLFGYATSMAIYDIILSLAGCPAFFRSYESPIRWIAVAVFCVGFAVVGWMLRRFGLSVALAFTATLILLYFTDNLIILSIVFLATLIATLIALRTVVILLSSLGGGIAALYFIIGRIGLYPYDLNALFHVSGVSILLIFGCVIGVFGAIVQMRFYRTRQYY